MVPDGDPKTEKGPHGDPGPQMGTHLGAVGVIIKPYSYSNYPKVRRSEFASFIKSIVFVYYAFCFTSI